MKNFENKFSMRAVMQHWDRIAHEYDYENDKHKGIHNQRFTEALKYITLRKNMNILIVWVRTGGMLNFIEKKDINIVGLELSYNLLKKGKEKNKDNFLAQSSLHHFPLKNNIFDLVISLETLEHVPNPAIFLGEICRVLKNGGRLVMSTPINTNELAARIIETFKLHHSEGPRKILSYNTVKKILKDTNLKLEYYKPTLPFPAGPDFLYKIGCVIEGIVDKTGMKNTPLKYLFYRHFYICRK